MPAADATDRHRQTLRIGRRLTAVSVAGNSFLVFLKGWVGLATGSSGLVADAIHSVADLVMDFMAYGAVHLGAAEADDNHPYGHGKFEALGTIVLCLCLALTGIFIGHEAISNIRHGHEGTLGFAALGAAGVALVLKEGLFRYCLHWGKAANSNALIANAWHHRADSISTLAVMAGIVLNMLGLHMADPLAALVVAVLLLHLAYTSGKDAFNELVDAAIPEEEQHDLHAIIAATPGVRACHQLRGRRLGGESLVDVHVDVDPMISVSEGHMIAEQVEHNLIKAMPHLTDVVVHIDPAGHTHEVRNNHPTRHELESLATRALGKHLPHAALERVTLHYMGRHVSADLLITPPAGTAATQYKKACAALHKALETPAGPFKSVYIALNAENVSK